MSTDRGLAHVASRPAFRAAVEHIGRLYDFAADPAQAELMTFVDADGQRYHRMRQVPAFLLARTRARPVYCRRGRAAPACNLEEPRLFNSAVRSFVTSVDAGCWLTRDPRSMITSLTGMDE